MLIYFLIVLIGSIVAAKLILGELRKERRDYVVLVQPSEVSDRDVNPSVSKAHEIISPAVDAPFIRVDYDSSRLMSDWEKVLAEKNAEIELLTKALESQKSQTKEIEKIKVLLERQIFESRQMNRDVKRELDALMAQGQKSQDEISRLRVELNYKNQLINQNEVKMGELKNRIAKLLPNASAPAQDTAAPKSEPQPDLGDFSFDQLDWRNKIND